MILSDKQKSEERHFNIITARSPGGANGKPGYLKPFEIFIFYRAPFIEQ